MLESLFLSLPLSRWMPVSLPFVFIYGRGRRGRKRKKEVKGGGEGVRIDQHCVAVLQAKCIKEQQQGTETQENTVME